MSKPVTRKHSAKVLTLKNVADSLGRNRTLHFTLIGGEWYYSGTSEINVSISEPDGFWKESIAKLVTLNSPFSLKSIKNSFYHGPNKSMNVYIRTWETNLPKGEYQREKQGMPF